LLDSITKGINISSKDIVLYNFTNFTTMFTSILGKPFRVVKNIDLGMMQTLIEACAGPRALVVDLNCELGHYKPFSFFIFE